MASMGGSELAAVSSFFNQPAENLGNDPQLEMLWALKAYEHAEVYFNLIKSVDPKTLRLCPIGDEIYKAFRAQFPDLAINFIDESLMKSVEGKEKWRLFCNSFEGQVNDWNMATLLRIDCTKDVSEDNSVIVPRIQFLAIETARNREGLNSDLRRVYGQRNNASLDTPTTVNGST